MQINSLNSTVIIGEALETALDKALKTCKSDKVFVLTDTNTRQHCLPLLQKIEAVKHIPVLTIPAGEEHKSVHSVEQVWQFLTQQGADRKSVLINLGGGMIGDLGGFAAATYKRGIDFINIPTTLLAQVDASIGGKLGFNFAGLKNQIGLFSAPRFVIVAPVFLQTIDRDNFLSGFAEMVKHALVYSSEHWKKLKEFDLTASSWNQKQLETLISKSVLIKNDFVQSDFTEKSRRKALNFGHTFGHAIESLLLEQARPILHGTAVAHGMVCEMYLSHLKFGLSLDLVNEIRDFVAAHYGHLPHLAPHFDQLLALMQHDKKNERNQINFTLLSAIGEVEINKTCELSQLRQAFDYYLTQKD